jgi:hypothetical protein
MIDPAYTDILLAARKATRAPKDEKPRSLEEAIANLEAITNRILEKRRTLEDGQRALKQKLATVTGEIEQRWRAIERQLNSLLVSM